MIRLFGIETEYGITREDVDTLDPVVESMELVRCHRRPFRSDWDYDGEDPKQDARGFRAKTLQQEQEELDFEKQDRHRPFSFHEMKSDLMLGNGARFYNDHTHPEYSTPECASLKDLIAHDRAGERILLACAKARDRALGSQGAVQLYKNNTDHHGHSYGCHDNYLLPRHLPFNDLHTFLIPFLVTRQVFAGAGKVGIEIGNTHQQGIFQLSQRADFIEVEVSIDTMHKRPILNTRDEPHADPKLYRRLHLILGDSNMSEYATALKVGTTWIVLQLIEQGLAPKEAALQSPVETIRNVSRDTSLRYPMPLSTGKTIRPIDHQRLYLDAAKKAFSKGDEETTWILENWESTLDILDKDFMQLADRIDWISKLWLLETFMDAESVGWEDPRLASLDLSYHNIDPERGLFLCLESEGKIHRFISDAVIQEAMDTPPPNTRAGIRGLLVQKYINDIDKIQWESISFKGGLREQKLPLDNLFDSEEIKTIIDRIQKSNTIDEFLNT
ncbi:proteasome accessory factor PafA2 family protein [Nitrospira defluvii]|nr:proteasome accessory factor PafA2 family protein [Nitrospira defluvii]